MAAAEQFIGVPPNVLKLDKKRNISFVKLPIEPIPSEYERILTEHLILIWERMKFKIEAVIESPNVPVHNMAHKGLNPNNPDDAFACVTEVYRLIQIDYLHLAVAYLRGYRDFFGSSTNTKIKQMFAGINEIQIIKEIYLQKETEKILYDTKPPLKAPHL